MYRMRFFPIRNSARSEPIEFRERTNIAEYIRNNPNIDDLMMDRTYGLPYGLKQYL